MNMSHIAAARQELKLMLERRIKLDIEIAKLENYIEVESRLGMNGANAPIADKIFEFIQSAGEPISARRLAEKLEAEGTPISLPALYSALKHEHRLEGIRGKGFVIVH
jgi:hypothetical protein